MTEEEQLSQIRAWCVTGQEDTPLAWLLARLDAVQAHLATALEYLRDNCVEERAGGERGRRTCRLCDYTWHVEDRYEQHATDCFFANPVASYLTRRAAALKALASLVKEQCSNHAGKDGAACRCDMCNALAAEALSEGMPWR